MCGITTHEVVQKCNTIYPFAFHSYLYEKYFGIFFVASASHPMISSPFYVAVSARMVEQMNSPTRKKDGATIEHIYKVTSNKSFIII